MNQILPPWRATLAGALPDPAGDAGVPRAGQRALHMLARLPVGSLHLQLPDGTRRTLPAGPASPGPSAEMQLHDWQAVVRTRDAGDIGFAEAYLDGQWSAEDVVAVLELFLANRQHLDRVIHGSLAGRLWYLVRHALRRNSRAGSRRNIRAHYDLGNAFYRLWLDRTMSYSSGLYADAARETLESAQERKIRRALEQAGVRPGCHVLEIGCGWGALARVAARDYGARVTGITLSSEQLAYARAQAAQEGLSANCEFLLLDYRDLPRRFAGMRFDAVVSIEMFEAVGEAYWDGFLQVLQAMLRPGARACLQTITIRDDLFARYRRGTDFIQQYIFPGGMLPCRAAFHDRVRRAGLQVAGEHAFGLDYARTLRAWREAFQARATHVRALGYGERFIRLWDFYLAYCIAGFTSGSTDVAQFTLQHRA